MARISLALASAIALAVTAVPLRAEPPQTVQEAALRLAAMDTELTRCWRARAAAVVIAVVYLRKCIAERRGEERGLRGDLNKRIGMISTDDPERKKFIFLRQILIDWTQFTKQVDGDLKGSGKSLSNANFTDLVDDSCDGLGGAKDPFHGTDREDLIRLFDTPIPSACEPDKETR
ncbi:MAG: hypothetical protein P8J20_01770 [Novosphingobium sp.]|nr:hypothetical protein [Novosphingobium sp.]